jgi:hypothetical protein
MFTFSQVLKAGICVGSFALIAGCAIDPPDPDLQRTFVPVQAHQMDDLRLSCADLESEIHVAENSVAILDKQIRHDQDQSQSFSLGAALSAMSGALATNVQSAQISNVSAIASGAGASMSANDAMTKAQLRANLEQRHEALMQIFYTRRCQTT